MDYSDEIITFPIAVVERTGVVTLDYGRGICVDSKDLVAALYQKVHSRRPCTDYQGNFAATVTLTITFLGEMEEAQDGP